MIQILKACFLAIGLACVLPVGAVVIDFDGFSDGTIINPGDLNAFGLTFDQRLEVDDGDITGLLPGQSPPNFALNIDTFASSVSGSFLSPVSFVSVLAGDSGGDVDTIRLNVYDAANALVGTDVFVGSAGQVLSASGAGITRFEIIDVNNTLFIFDDLTFNRAPEPGTLALLGLSLAGLAASRRRKQ